MRRAVQPHLHECAGARGRRRCPRRGSRRGRARGRRTGASARRSRRARRSCGRPSSACARALRVAAWRRSGAGARPCCARTRFISARTERSPEVMGAAVAGAAASSVASTTTTAQMWGILGIAVTERQRTLTRLPFRGEFHAFLHRAVWASAIPARTIAPPDQLGRSERLAEPRPGDRGSPRPARAWRRSRRASRRGGGAPRRPARTSRSSRRARRRRRAATAGAVRVVEVPEEGDAVVHAWRRETPRSAGRRPRTAPRRRSRTR